MLSMYPACFFKEDEGYSVVFPDLNYLSTCGKTLQDAMTAAVDCLAGYLYTAQLDNDEIQNPSGLKSIVSGEIAKEIYLDVIDREVLVSMVSVDVAAYARKSFDNEIIKK